MLSVFALLGMVNAYFFFFRGGTSLRHLLRLTEAGKTPPALIGPDAAASPPAPAPEAAVKPSRTPTPPPLEPFDEGRAVEGTVGVDESLEAAISEAGVSAGDVSAVAAALDKIWPRRPSGELGYVVRFDIDERPQVVDVRKGSLGVRIVRGHGTAPKWTAALDGRSVSQKTVEVHGAAGWSVFEGIQRAGEQPALAHQLAAVFASELNLNTDAYPGDLFRVVVEKHLIGGRLDRYGRILAAEWRGRAGTFRAFWFQPSVGEGGYFTERGERVSRVLVRSPLRLCRPPATFDKRHLLPVPATDKGSPAGAAAWSAPVGTQAVALGDGKVLSAGPRPGLGVVVVMALSDGAEVTYAQLARLGPSVKAGRSVRTLDVLGTLGTRPLILSLRRLDGGPVADALHLKTPRLPPLASDQRQEFADRISPRLKQLLAL